MQKLRNIFFKLIFYMRSIEEVLFRRVVHLCKYVYYLLMKYEENSYYYTIIKMNSLNKLQYN